MIVCLKFGYNLALKKHKIQEIHSQTSIQSNPQSNQSQLYNDSYNYNNSYYNEQQTGNINNNNIELPSIPQINANIANVGNTLGWLEKVDKRNNANEYVNTNDNILGEDLEDEDAITEGQTANDQYYAEKDDYVEY